MSDAANQQPPHRASISEAEAVQLCTGLIDAMKGLELLLAEETQRVRNHSYDGLEELNADKAKLSKAYMEFMAALRDELPFIKEVAPDLLDLIRGRHDTLQIIICDNLTAIGAAKAVSENLLLTIADEVQKKRQPLTAYTSTGGTPQSGRAKPAIAVNERF